MQGLLARINQQQKNPKLASRSASIASSVDDHEEEQQSDESQSQQTPNTLKPKVRKDKKPDNKKLVKPEPAVDPNAEVKKPRSRIDTNMVKLKLLDATRKAIIDKTKKQYTSSYAQTDSFKTKLCKDQSVENQSDLMHQCDQSTETEVELVAMKARDGTLIITSTCAINTDKVSTADVACMTMMPRSSVGFSNRFKDSKHSVQYADDDELTNEDSDDHNRELLQIEKRLRSKKKLHRQRSSTRSNIDIVVEDETSEVIAVESFKSEKKNSDSEFEDSIQEDCKPSGVKQDRKTSKKTDETFNSWHGLDVPDDKVELPRSYFTDGPTPWSNFQDLVLGQRFLNARLSPSPQQQFQSSLKQVAWSDSQIKIVTDLIREANALMDMFDQVAMLLGPDIKLHNVSDVEEFVLPPSKYGDELVKSCDKLEASLKRLQDIKTSS